ncbi:MAG TPA: type II toxin-antitoxin system HicB family antitoxin [Gemmataceae bacterium]|nr:type II toxin-antitoxin system HicB family antitoxin [Gemmataceae bacterium]
MPKQKPARQKSGQTYVYPVVVEKDGDGYFVSCPALDGCFTEGDTYEEALKNIEEAIALHIEGRRARGEPVPAADSVSLAAVEVRV